MSNNDVWLVDDDASIRWVLERALCDEALGCCSFSRPSQVLERLASGDKPAVLICDVRMPEMDGLTLMQRVHETWVDLPVIIMTAHSDLDSAVQAYQQGAFEYLPKPFDLDDVTALVKRALAQTPEQSDGGTAQGNTETRLIGEAPAMQEVFRAIGRLSHSSVSVLINGASGTGKELVAKALHQHSPRASQPFVALNMAAIPPDLVESELFGHEKGAFTGANSQRRGRFEQAQGGTLFLDEIGDMPIDTQTRLLRVLAEGQFYRVGGHAPVTVNVRIIAATHQDLFQRVSQGKFREDLFHRLNVIRIQLPLLAQRAEDIPALANYFMQHVANELGVEAKRLAPETLALLTRLPWPGNVRQLENVCRWLTVMASASTVLPDDLPEDLLTQSLSQDTQQAAWHQAVTQELSRRWRKGEQGALVTFTRELERLALHLALQQTQGHKQQAAGLLGWGRNTLTRKLKESGLGD